MGVCTFPKGISLKVNIIAQLMFELAYHEAAVHHISRYASEVIQLAEIHHKRF